MHRLPLTIIKSGIFHTSMAGSFGLSTGSAKTVSNVNSKLCNGSIVGCRRAISDPSEEEKEVGDRLGMLALSKTYGMKGFEAESPTFSKMEVEGNKAIIHFDNQFNGLTSYGKTLELFEISGDNKVFHKADAYIDEEKVLW